jgi:hypothetical protein
LLFLTKYLEFLGERRKKKQREKIQALSVTSFQEKCNYGFHFERGMLGRQHVERYAKQESGTDVAIESGRRDTGRVIWWEGVTKVARKEGGIQNKYPTV